MNIRKNFILALSILLMAVVGCENNDLTSTDINGNVDNIVKNKPVSGTSTAVINPDNCGATAITPLIAGQYMDAGYISVTLDGNMLSVTYEANDGWIISETQLHVAATKEELPQNAKGNPVIGNFEFKAEHTPPVSSYTYSDIDVSDLGEVAIAAHAVVSRVAGTGANLEAIENNLPDNFNFKVAFLEDPTYLEATITNSGTLDGVYGSFCVDLDHGIKPGTDYEMSAVSSYSSNTDLLGKLVDKPENLDLLNYIINQDYSELGARGNEIQAVIWTLIDDITPESGRGAIEWNQDVVDAIIADAYENGEGFVPECDDKVFIIMNPGGDIEDPVIKSQVTIVQVTVIEFPNVCETVYTDTETAWGQGVDFSDGSWAMYFKYCIDQPTNCEVDMDVVNDYIPAEKVNVVLQFMRDPSYFQTTISNGGVLDGSFEGNCVDLDHGISSGKLHQMYIFSTYSEDTEWLAHYVDKPENYDLINYLVNQDYSAIGATGTEEQAAIWTLIDDRDLTNGTGGIIWNQDVVDQMIADAEANGEGYVPECGGYVVFIMDPNPGRDIRYQVTLIKFPVSQIPNSSVSVY